MRLFNKRVRVAIHKAGICIKTPKQSREKNRDGMGMRRFHEKKKKGVDLSLAVFPCPTSCRSQNAPKNQKPKLNQDIRTTLYLLIFACVQSGRCSRICL